MITLLLGENSFEIERAIEKIVADFDGVPEKINADNLQPNNLPDLLMGVSLFSVNRLVIIRNLSENKSVWSALINWIERISDDIHLILIETKVDKRTNTYKLLKEVAILKEFNSYTERDALTVEKWLAAEADNLNLKLDKKCTQALLQRVGVDQWQLFHALQKLSLVGEVTPETIAEIIDPNPTENAFNLFETAIKGDIAGVQSMLAVLKQTEDVYRLFGLLSSQVFQLAAIVTAGKSDNPAKDFGIHPFVVSKMKPIANRLGKSGVSKILAIFADTDIEMKSSSTDPWLLIETALLKISNL